MKRIKIALGDLRHKTIGRHSVFMPVGIGYIASFTLAQMGKDNVEIKLYDDPDSIIKDIRSWKPDVIGLSNYCWNSELSRLVFQFAKSNNRRTVCVAGGPEFPVQKEECLEYLLERPEIDFYVYFEGEVTFVKLIQRILTGIEIENLKRQPQEGIMSIDLTTRRLISGKPCPRITNLDVIPSPYLSGLMDQWFNGYYGPAVETARGCPFSCGYCFAGQDWFNNMATFSVQRIKDELTYIAKKMQLYPYGILLICDSNFGIYTRDEEIARHCRVLQDKYGWPNVFDVTTGKANYGRILKIAALLKNRMYVTCSLQSLNKKTLKVIRRQNVPIDKYNEIQKEIKQRGMLAVSELIVPMPEETKVSFLKGMKTILNSGIGLICPYTTMLLKGTYLASWECRKKYKMETRFRILPRQFSEYLNEKCFEIEEVCVATNTMPFVDYLEIRGFALLAYFFCLDQFDVVHKHLKEFKISNYDFYYYLWRLIKSDKTALSSIYRRYIEETKNELWRNREEIYKYYKSKENYNKLLTGEAGDNLIRKYSTEFLLYGYIPAIELAYTAIKDMHPNLKADVSGLLNATKYWILQTRNLSALFKEEVDINLSKVISLPYDIEAWYSDDSKPVLFYRNPVKYRIFYDKRKLNMIFSHGEKLFGEELLFRVGKLLTNWNIKDFWCQYERLNES